MSRPLSAERLGRLTASCAAVWMGGLETEGLKENIRRLAWERVNGPFQEGFRSKAMDRGHEVEDVALDWYVFAHDVSDLERPEFVKHPKLDYVGCSPDAIRADRTVEVKSPLELAYMECLTKPNEIPSEYRWQIRWQLWCCLAAGVVSANRCDFVVFHPSDKSGGLVIPGSVTDEECDAMAKRAALIERNVKAFVKILEAKRA